MFHWSSAIDRERDFLPVEPLQLNTGPEILTSQVFLKGKFTLAKGDSKQPRSEKIDVVSTPDSPAGNAILAGWQGVHHLFGGQFDKVEVVPEVGVNVIGFSTNADYDPNQLVKDISHRNRRLDFLNIYPIVQGKAQPPEFADSKEITQWMTQFFRNSTEEGSARAPKYARDAVTLWKSERNMAKKRGPRKKSFRIDELSSIDADTLKNAKKEDIESLKSVLETLMVSLENGSTETVEDTATAGAAS